MHVHFQRVVVWAGALGMVACADVGRESDDGGSGIESLSSTATGGGTSGDGSDGEAGGDADTGAGSTAGGDSADDGLTGSSPKFDVGNAGDGGDGGNEGCGTDPNVDDDGDGWTEAEGDCNDCDANVNPGAIEVEITEPDMMGMIPEPADEDCDGQVDNVPQPCDGAFSIDDADPYNAAGAMELCKLAQGPDDWGVVDAQWVRADGSALGGGIPQHGIMNDFGPNVLPLGGAQVLGLSSGHARDATDPNACGALSCYGTGSSTAPPGFPQDVPNCPGGTAIYDDIALEVTLRAPTNATGFSYNFDFYSFEYPEWVCTTFNDQYIALMNPAPMGAINGNISFDSQTNPVSVNIAFFEVCSGCTLGTAELQGTGFDTWDDAGATSWLVTTAPVTGGTEFTIRFAIWDTGDQAWDSTVLLDNFQWIADGGTVDLGTEPEG